MEGLSWKESSLTTVGMNLARREKGVVLALVSTCLSPKQVHLSPSLGQYESKMCMMLKVLLLADFSAYSESSMILF